MIKKIAVDMHLQRSNKYYPIFKLNLLLTLKKLKKK